MALIHPVLQPPWPKTHRVDDDIVVDQLLGPVLGEHDARAVVQGVGGLVCALFADMKCGGGGTWSWPQISP